MGLLDIHTVEKQHVEVNIQIERRSKTLDQGDRARLGHLVGMARFLDQVRGNDAESFLPDMLINFALINITDRKNRVPIPLMVTGRPMKDAVTGIM